MSLFLWSPSWPQDPVQGRTCRRGKLGCRKGGTHAWSGAQLLILNSTQVTGRGGEGAFMCFQLKVHTSRLPVWETALVPWPHFS